MEKRKMLSSIMAIGLSVATLLAVSSAYAWIKREWSPQVYSPELVVQTNGSLSIKLAESGASLDEIDLNQVLGLNGDFKLKQISSLTGESDTFYTIDYAAGKGKEVLSYLNKSTYTGTTSSFAKDNGFIEQVFILVCQAREDGNTNYTKHIFIDDTSSYIQLYNSATGAEADASEALRVSITIEGGTTSQGTQSSSNIHYLFKKTVTSTIKHVGATYTPLSADTKNPVQNGERIYTTDDDGEITGLNQNVIGTNTNVFTFSDFNGGGQDENGNYNITNDDHTLFTMSNVETRKVTLRIWLEGYDDACIDEIAGSKIMFKLVFKSVDIISET